MARPNKIEQYRLQNIVARCLSSGITSVRKIAFECTNELKKKGIKDEISHTAVARYIESSKYEKQPANPSAAVERKKAAVTQVSGRVERIINFDIDIIELQYKTTNILLERFNFIVELPDMFERRMDQLIESMKQDGTDSDYWGRWKVAFADDLRRNVQNITSLNRELRENSKFMADMRSKAFEFDLIQEYLYLFMEVFRKADLEAYEVASAQIAANPRMQRIVEQQQQLRGGDME